MAGVGDFATMSWKHFTRLFLVITLTLVAVFPWAASAQSSDPLETPATVEFTGSSDLEFSLLNQIGPLKVTMGNYSGEATGNISIVLMVDTADGSSVYSAPLNETLKLSGRYKDGIMEGDWNYEAVLTERPNDIEYGSVTSKIKASGTFRTNEVITSKTGSVTFEGKSVTYFDDYEDSELVQADREVEETISQYAQVRLTVSGGGGPGGGGGSAEAPPGIGGIGDLPGPDNLAQTLAGILLPGIVGILGGILAGTEGGIKPEAPPDEPRPEGPEGEDEETDDDDAGEDGSDSRRKKRRPAAGGMDPATRHAQNVLDIFDKRSEIDHNPKLKALADKARATAFKPDGNIDPEKWAQIKEEMRDAISDQIGPTGIASTIIIENQAIAEGVYNTAADAVDKTKEGVQVVGDGISKAARSVKEGFEGIGYGIMNIGDFFRGVNQKFLDWNHRNTEEFRSLADAVDQANRSGDYAPAIKALGASFIEPYSKVLEVARELLPVEEFSTLLDGNATIDEKLWAIPAAASRLAALLAGTEAGSIRVPGTGTSSFIPSARAAAAAEEAAAAGTSVKGARVTAAGEEAAASKATGAGQTADSAGAKTAAGDVDAAAAAEKAEAEAARQKATAARKAEAGAEAKAAEAEKAAARRAENTRGDAARAREEARFNDPEQRPAYEGDYKKYMDDARKKADAVADTVKSGEKPSVDQAMENMSDPAAMRNLKNAPEDVRKSFIETQNKIIEPTNREVESFLGQKYPGEEFKVESVRTPGKSYDPATAINTDNDVHALRKVTNPDGSTSWREVPSDEWKQAYHDSFAKNSNFSTGTARERFPEVDWDHMTPQQQTRKWGELHQQEPGDVFDPTSGRDFRKGSAGPGSDEAAHAAAKKGEARLTDAEQLGMMEEAKFNDKWNRGTIPEQKEALEQLTKQGREVEGLIAGQKNLAHVSDLSPKMKEALKVIEDNTLSPLDRAQRVRELGFPGGPAEVSSRLRSRIESLKIARPK